MLNYVSMRCFLINGIIMLIQNDSDLEKFMEEYDISAKEITKE